MGTYSRKAHMIGRILFSEMPLKISFVRFSPITRNKIEVGLYVCVHDNVVLHNGGTLHFVFHLTINEKMGFYKENFGNINLQNYHILRGKKLKSSYLDYRFLYVIIT